jgi:hypothetical protein
MRHLNPISRQEFPDHKCPEHTEEDEVQKMQKNINYLQFKVKFLLRVLPFLKLKNSAPYSQATFMDFILFSE